MMRYDEIRGEIAAGTAARTLPAWAAGVVDDVAEGRSPVPAVRHPLGFLCLPVERSGEFGVCLHIWTPEVQPAPSTTSPVHCHSWDLLSYVLYGTVRNVRMRIQEMDIEDGGPATHRVFEVVSRDGTDELRATGRGVRHSPGGSTTHRTGDSYTLPAGVFHSTLIEHGQDAATVALGRQAAGGDDLSLGPLDGGSHRVDRIRSDPGETVRALRRSARLIAAAHTASTALPGATAPPGEDHAHPGGRHCRSARGYV